MIADYSYEAWFFVLFKLTEKEINCVFIMFMYVSSRCNFKIKYIKRYGAVELW